MVNVGDYVVWQKPSYTNADGQSFMPMGIRGCKVIWIGNETLEDCVVRRVAHLEWKPFYGETVTFRADLDHLTKLDPALDKAS